MRECSYVVIVSYSTHEDETKGVLEAFEDYRTMANTAILKRILAKDFNEMTNLLRNLIQKVIMIVKWAREAFT